MKTLLFDLDPRGVGTLTLNRPEKRNALSAEMIAELTDWAAAINARADVRAVVLTGAGEVFCAGGDLGWMHQQIAADRTGRMAEARKLAMMLKSLNELHKPLIGRVQGAAYGGGLGLLAVCDSVIASTHAMFAFTETRLGLIPATISPYCIARMGEGSARRVIMSAALFDVKEAVRLGLVRTFVAPEALDTAVAEEVAPYLKVSMEAVSRSKQLARSLGPVIDEVTIERTVIALADAWETDDAAKGISAFLEKRKPEWT